MWLSCETGSVFWWLSAPEEIDKSHLLPHKDICRDKNID
jgi:hypothetical protein